jgi:hypothetical protein
VTELASLHPPSRGARARSTQGWRCELAWINAVAVVLLRAVKPQRRPPERQWTDEEGQAKLVTFAPGIVSATITLAGGRVVRPHEPGRDPRQGLGH